MKTYNNGFHRKQTGAVTLLVTLLILIAITVGSFAMVGTSTLESRMSANDRRAKEALQSAQSGIDFVLANLASNDIDLTVLCADDTLESYGFQINFRGPTPGDFSTRATTCAEQPFALLTKLQVWSQGYSADQESVRTVVSTIDLTSPWEWKYETRKVVGGGGTAPIVARGNVHFQGTPEAARCETMEDCVDWANKKGNQSGVIDGTLVMAGGNITDQGNVPMSDVNYKANDGAIAALTADQLFAQYASNGYSFAEFKALSGTHMLGSSANAETINSTKRNQFWVEGDLDLKASGQAQIGSPDKPVILVVKGDFKVTGNVVIWGVVYAETADFTTGTVNIMGSMVSENDVEMGGNAAVYYHPDLRPAPDDYDPDDAYAGYAGARESSVRLGSWREVINQ